ncbi:hypothetical protein ACIQ4I_13855 [Rummeliibacillus sp. NPDC094406]|uniref:hypothetical protein n=1 Tax=Rummeliibacillus sp. NPDC094406 TaxID=3364511 RepID=UPI003818A4EC
MTEQMDDTNVLLDERVQEILRGLTQGKTREELAKKFGHKSYKTLDMYMRRRNFEWGSAKENYKLAISKKETAVVDTSKAYRIIQLIDQQEELDLQRVALLNGFDSYKELAAYMGANHYSWSSEHSNYVKQTVFENQLLEGNPPNVSSEPSMSTLPTMTINTKEVGWAEYLPLLKMLKNNELRLLNLLQPYGTGGQIPRYTIPGVAKTKTVQMIHSLDQMVTDFAKEKNMTQRDVFEVALIDFFKRYGYEKQVEVLLK